MKSFHKTSSLLDKPLNPNGRFCRHSFAAWSFLNTIICIFSVLLILSIFNQFHATSYAKSMTFLGYLLTLGVLVCFFYYSFIISIRRLHDQNLSGWWSLLLIVPILNFLFFLYLLYNKGDDGMNKYGFSRIIFGWEKILGNAYMIIAPFAILGFCLFLWVQRAYIIN